MVLKSSTLSFESRDDVFRGSVPFRKRSDEYLDIRAHHHPGSDRDRQVPSASGIDI